MQTTTPYKHRFIITYFAPLVNALRGYFRYKRTEIYKKVSNFDKVINYQRVLRGQKLGLFQIHDRFPLCLYKDFTRIYFIIYYVELQRKITTKIERKELCFHVKKR